MVEYLPSMCEALGSIPITTKIMKKEKEEEEKGEKKNTLKGIKS